MRIALKCSCDVPGFASSKDVAARSLGENFRAQENFTYNLTLNQKIL